MSILREMGKNYLRSLVIYLIAGLIGIPCMCLLVFLPLWYVNEQNLSGWYLIIPFGLFLFFLFGGGFGSLAGVTMWRKRQLDALFTPLGLQGSAYATFFRQYHGDFGERQARAYFSRGPMVEIEVSTNLKTRLGIIHTNAETNLLASAFGQPPIDLGNATLSDLAVFASDADWAQQLLSQAQAAGLLRQLIGFEGSFNRRYLVLRPGWLSLNLFGSRRLIDFNFDLAPQQASQFLNILSRLASLAESLPAPSTSKEATALEQTAEKVKNRNPYLVPAITVITTLLLIFCTSAFVIVLVMLLRQ
jgi:hypothetical protein